MIAYLSGRVFSKNPKSIIILNNQQVGYEVFLSAQELEKTQTDTEASFFIFTHVKEDALDLYGFSGKEQLEFFKQLLSVSGVGPKSAINIIGLADLTELKRAITSGDPSLLQQVSGIGKKTAERLVVELKEKILIDLSQQKITSPENDQVVEALVSLGYKEKEAREIIKNIRTEGDLGAKVKEALNLINQRSHVS